MTHFTTPDFWQLYNVLPRDVQQLADKNYALLKSDPAYPSLQFKSIENVWSVRVGSHYRAVAYRQDGDFVWFWIGTHAEYDKMMP
jgi:hypothetical protein